MGEEGKKGDVENVCEFLDMVGTGCLRWIGMARVRGTLESDRNVDIKNEKEAGWQTIIIRRSPLPWWSSPLLHTKARTDHPVVIA